MNKYLLEIGTEELPYKFIPSAMEQLKTAFSSVLSENKISFGGIKLYASPRRLAVLIEDIPEKQEDVQKIIKGPAVSAAYDENGNLTKAALGFAAKNGINPSELYRQDGSVYAEIELKGRYTKDILREAAPGIILNIKGVHFMRWADLSIKFQRPIRWIVSLFNSETAEFELAGVKAGNITRGHRSLEQPEIQINHPDEYLSKLEKGFVIADIQKRRETIVKLAEEKAAEIGADTAIDENLLEEITFITEWPVPVICSFSEKYLKIPEKVTVTVMAVHQRYFPLFKNGKLLNKFITVSNFTGSNFDSIKAGNERVVAARLEDALFFLHEDLQRPLISYLEDLKGITFQKGLGSMYDKTQRIVLLAEYIADELKLPSETIERTALLCKADLASKLVFEFTELQGCIGRDYALKSGEDERTALGIMEHYFPLNAEAETASGIEGQITGTADKIDTITAVFAAGKKVSGSQDPLGVRRAALGILKTVMQKNLNINLSKLIKLAIDNMPVKIDDKSRLEASIKEFLSDRLIILLSDKYRRDVLESCAAGKDILSNLQDFIKRLDAVSSKLNSRDYPSFNEGINRIIRIIKNEKSFSAVNEALFMLPEEKELYNAAKIIDENGLDYEQLFEKLFKLSPLISAFFDKVLVMDKDEKIKNNRLGLLNAVKAKFDKIADFSRIAC